MTKAIRSEAHPDLSGEFLKEYSSEISVRKYTKATAGHGIGYLLDHDYGHIYREVLEKYIAPPRKREGIRLWEFGCGAGMNLLHLVSVVQRQEIALDCAYGTDFSDALIQAAKQEAVNQLAPELNQKVHFCAAKNEYLIEDTTKSLGISRDAIVGSFDIVFGINTIRYCHRLKNEDKCTKDISELLRDGGVCIIIDMNQKFPAFRSRFRDRRTMEKEAYYLPSLDEYARPFASAGFDILRKENFCWIPHSAGAGLTAVMKTFAPLLNACVRDHAMRSLVISRKTMHGRA